MCAFSDEYVLSLEKKVERLQADIKAVPDLLAAVRGLLGLVQDIRGTIPHHGDYAARLDKLAVAAEAAIASYTLGGAAYEPGEADEVSPAG